MLLRFALYFRPHLFGVLGSVAVVWMIRTLSVMGGRRSALVGAADGAGPGPHPPTAPASTLSPQNA